MRPRHKFNSFTQPTLKKREERLSWLVKIQISVSIWIPAQLRWVKAANFIQKNLIQFMRSIFFFSLLVLQENETIPSFIFRPPSSNLTQPANSNFTQTNYLKRNEWVKEPGCVEISSSISTNSSAERERFWMQLLKAIIQSYSKCNAASFLFLLLANNEAKLMPKFGRGISFNSSQPIK